MATSEERLKILQMIQEEKISPEDGAKLLAALNKGAARGGFAAASAVGTPGAGRYMRVRVTDVFSGENKVSVNLPLSLVDAGLSIASNFVPDISKVDIVGAIKSGMTGKVIDITDEEEHVEIFIE